MPYRTPAPRAPKLTRKAAREIAKRAKAAIVAEQMPKLLAEINKRARKGQTSCKLDSPEKITCVTALKSLGYTVRDSWVSWK